MRSWPTTSGPRRTTSNASLRLAPQRAAAKAMTILRVAVRFSENGLERAIRQVALPADGADNNATGGPTFKALFSNGLDA